MAGEKQQAATIAGIAAAVWMTVVGSAIGYAIGGLIGLLVLGGLCLVLGVVYGWVAASTNGYDLQSQSGAGVYLVDLTWSLPNTLLGALWLALNLMFGNTLDRAFTVHRNHIGLVKGPITIKGVNYATTIGTVYAGTQVNVHDHEAIHVLQARVFGPTYVPLVLANYVLATILPYWLLVRKKASPTDKGGRHPITGFGDYFQWGVYPHVWNEAWAYRAAP